MTTTTKQNRLLEKARNQMKALAVTVRELAALSNQAQLAELLNELAEQVK